MSKAIYAIPGLMTPDTFNFKSQVIAPEDGSLDLCVYCGEAGDKVTYTMANGTWRGVIKDPGYLYMDSERPKGVYTYPQFLYICEDITSDTIVPPMRYRDCVIPITENPNIDKEYKLYWVLRLPKGLLPPGDTQIEVVANNKKMTYTVQRPYYAIHSRHDRTYIAYAFSDKTNGALNVVFTQDASTTESDDKIVLDIISQSDSPEYLTGAEYRAFITMDGVEIELGTSVEENELTLHLDGLGVFGQGTWKAQYKVFSEWHDLAAGKIEIISKS